MHADMDALTSATLKHLRERWWNDEFTEFLAETLRPRAGNRILDVGCGAGTGEISIGRLHVSQLQLVGIDLVVDKAIAATAGHGRAQHARQVRGGRRVPAAVQGRRVRLDVLRGGAAARSVTWTRPRGEFARVTVGGGRVVAVEPDNAARYFYSSTPWGRRASQVAAQFFAARGRRARRHDRRRRSDRSCRRSSPGTASSRSTSASFPFRRSSSARCRTTVWADRRARVERAIAQAPDLSMCRRSGREYLVVLDAYHSEAKQAGASFIEIQNTMLFATVGQRSE